MDQQKIGRYIAERRKALGLTQAQLAQQLGVTDKSVSKWERGVCLPDVSLYQPLCKILGITLSEFFSGEPAEHPIDASIAEKTILAVAEDGEARRKKYNRIITILVVIGLLLSASLFYAMRQTVRDPLSFKDHIRQSQLEPSQWQMVHMLSGRNSAFLYDFSYKQDLPWLSFIIREYRHIMKSLEECNVLFHRQFSHKKRLKEKWVSNTGRYIMIPKPPDQFVMPSLRDGKHILIRLSCLCYTSLGDPTCFFHRLQFPVDLTGLRCPEMIQGIPEYCHNFITCLVAIANQAKNTMF